MNMYLAKCGADVLLKESKTKKDTAFTEMQYYILEHEVIENKILFCEQKDYKITEKKQR